MPTEANNSIIDRIKKLIRLAKDAGAQGNEAPTAMKMAANLMSQHGLEEWQVADHPEGDRPSFVPADVHKATTRPLGRHLDNWETYTAAAICNACDCKSVRLIYSPGNHEQVFFGVYQDAEVALELFLWAIERAEMDMRSEEAHLWSYVDAPQKLLDAGDEQIQRWSQQALYMALHPKKWRNDFLMGWANGVWLAVVEEKRNMRNDGNLPAIVADIASAKVSTCDVVMRAEFEDLKDHPSLGWSGNLATYEAGERRGKSHKIGRGANIK